MRTLKGKEYFHPDETYPISKDRLREAKADYQIEVMKDWFHQHFENPVEITPYESAEGGYIYVWGGPYDAREELESEFDGVVSQKAIGRLVDELEEGCSEWSGKPTSEDYDEYYYNVIASNTDAHENLISAQDGTRRLLNTSSKGESRELLFRLLFVNAVTILETFLSDTFINTISADQFLLKKFVASNPDFKDRKFSLNELFDCLDKIEKDVRNYLLDLIWHNLPKVKEIYRSTLSIDFPDSMKPLYAAVIKRHDIVHRNGRDKEGRQIKVSRQDVEDILTTVRDLADHIDSHFQGKVDK